MDKEQIVCNAIQTPDGTVLESHHTHDYKEYRDNNGYIYSIDGGLSYLRRGKEHDAPDYKELSVSLSDGHDKVREAFTWGKNYDENMKLLPKTEYIKLKNITDSHLKSLISYTEGASNIWVHELFIIEKEWRKNEFQ